MQVRLVHEVGVRIFLRRYWDGADGPCSGPAGLGYHNALLRVADVVVDGWTPGGEVEVADAYLREGRPDTHDPRWQQVCVACKAPAPYTAIRQVYAERLFDTPSGALEPGDCYLTWLRHDHEDRCHLWDDCRAPHLVVVLPTGDEWDVDSRATNCTMLQDRRHRCWVRHGAPPQVTVNKQGVTCQAGAGSISVPGWHGFLTAGQLTPQ